MITGIIGTSIWQQNLPLIEALTFDREDRDQVLARLKDRLGLTELIYLATCNRVEFLYVMDDRHVRGNLLHRLLDFFFAEKQSVSFFPNDFYHYTGTEAIRHLFRTVCSLESLVVGETQITGQFVEASEEAARCGLSGPTLGLLSREARRVAKRVRRETEIGSGAVSMASLAASVLIEELDTTQHLRIALVGAGPMTHKCAAYVQKHLDCELVFVNRTAEKAVELADEFDGSAVSLQDFVNVPGAVDAIITATAAKSPIFGRDFLNQINEPGSKTVCLDLAIPRDFSDDFNNDELVTLVDIAELRAREQRNVRNRFVKVNRANEIVMEEVEKFVSNRIEVTLKPIFHRSYQDSVEMAQQALDDLFTNRLPSLDEAGRKEVSRMVNKLLGHSCFQPAKLLSDHLANEIDHTLLNDDIIVSRESA